MIRKMIDNSLNGFNGANVSVENIRLSYLAKYPMNDVTNYDNGSRLVAIRKIKEAIECTIPRTNLSNDLKTYDQYLRSEKLDDDEYTNFNAQLMYIQNKL